MENKEPAGGYFASLDLKPVRIGFAVIMILGIVLAMFPPKVKMFRDWANHAEWIALAYLMLGLFFLVINRTKLMMAAMGCSAVMSLFLLEMTNARLNYSKKKDLPTLQIGHFNVKYGYEDGEEFIRTLIDQHLDVYSFDRVTPAWDSLLFVRMGHRYPFCVRLPRQDGRGLALYSRLPFSTRDTFFFGDVANIEASLFWGDRRDSVLIMTTSVAEPNDEAGIRKMEGHLEKISYEINKRRMPTLCMGTFSTTGWSKEIQIFKAATDLSNSRMGALMPMADGGLPTLNVPFDHIFYSGHLECVHFSPIRYSHAPYIGIIGSYQIKKSTDVKPPGNASPM